MKAKVMNIFANNTLTKIVNNKTARKFVSQVSNPKALLPVILLETTVIAGRSYQAYKRGGKTECRERLIDESLTAMVWFGVITWLNTAFSKLIKLKGVFDKKGLPEIEVDVGSDAIRNPLQNAIRKRPNIKNKICSLKFLKIFGASLAGIYLSGIVLPKFYQGITKKILNKEKEERVKQNNIETNPNKNIQNTNELPASNKVSMDDFLNKISPKKQMSFGSAATFIHALENNPIYKLLTVDTGLFAGRVYSSRNADEGFEFGFRDVVSAFFYMFSTPLIFRGISNYFDKYKGKNTNLDPKTAQFVTETLTQKLAKKPMGVDEFKDYILGTNRDLATKILHKLEGETVDIERLKKVVNELIPDESFKQTILKRAEEFIALRPEGSSKNLLPTSEVINSVMGGEFNNPKFIKEAISVATDGISQNPDRFISYKEIDKIKYKIIEYGNSIVDYAKNQGKTDITSDIITQVRNRNFICKSAYTLVGLAVSALFLSTLIPKLQYKITEWRTGNKEFPGIRDIK